MVREFHTITVFTQNFVLSRSVILGKKKYTNYLTDLKGRFGKISHIFWGTMPVPKIVFAEPKTCFYNFKITDNIVIFIDIDGCCTILSHIVNYCHILYNIVSYFRIFTIFSNIVKYFSDIPYFCQMLSVCLWDIMNIILILSYINIRYCSISHFKIVSSLFH